MGLDASLEPPIADRRNRHPLRGGHSRFWLTAGLMILGMTRIIWMLPAHKDQNDFAHYYLSSRLLIEGRDPYGTPLEPLYESHGFKFDARIPNATNPPPLLWLVAPFSLLPPTAAHMTWATFSFLSLAVCLLLTRRWGCPEWPSTWWSTAVVIVLWSYPVFDHFKFSQVQLTLAALLLGAFACQQSKKPGWACGLAALAAAVKLFPVLVLPWFLLHGTDGWREVVRRVVIVFGVWGLVLVATGTEIWQEFVTYALPVISAGTQNQWGNQSLPSLVLNIAGASRGFSWDQDSSRFWWLLASITGAATLGGAYWILWSKTGDIRIKFAVLVLAMVISGTTAWTHYFVFLIWPALVAVDLATRQPTVVRRMTTGLMVLLLVLPLGDVLASALTDLPALANVCLGYSPLFGAALACGSLLTSLGTRNQTTSTTRTTTN